MPIKNLLLARITRGSTTYRLLYQLRNHPLSAIVSIPYAIYLTKKATGRFFPLRFVYSGRYIPVTLSKSKGAKLNISDKVVIESWGQGNQPITISLGTNASFSVTGELIIGQGCMFILGANSTLDIKGRRYSSGSGITCDTKIIVEQSINIGYDCIIAWGCSIMDSNWHELSDTCRARPIKIGDNVWIGHEVSVLPGATLGDGCVIGARSLVTGREYPPKSLFAGVPAKLLRENVTWSR